MVAILEFLENSIIAQNQLALIRNIKNVSNIFKLNIWLEKLEIKMYFKKIQVKIVKMAVEKVVGNGSNSTGLINTPLSSSINSMNSHQMSLQ